MNFEKKRSGIRFFGLSRQDCIKYYFGGNASVAVFILVLICAFLIKEAWQFFPGHHKQLQLYRKSGLEYLTWIDDAYHKYKFHTGALNRAYQSELAWPNRENQILISAYESTRNRAEDYLGDTLIALRDAIEQRNRETDATSVRAQKLDTVIAKLKSRIDTLRPRLAEELSSSRLRKIPKETQAQIVEEVSEWNFHADEESAFLAKVRKDFETVQENTEANIGALQTSYQTFRSDIVESLDQVWKEASELTRGTRDRAKANEIVPRQIQGHVNTALASDDPLVRQNNFGAVLKIVAETEYFDEYARIFYLFRFTEALFSLKPDGAAYDALPATTREKVESILNNVTGNFAAFVEVLETGGDELDSFPKAVPAGTMDPDMRKDLFDLTRIEKGTDNTLRTMSDEAGKFVNAFAFDKEARKVYDLTERYTEAVEVMKSKGLTALENLPSGNLQTKQARKEIEKFRTNFAEDIRNFEKVGAKLESWKYDRKWSWFDTIGAVFTSGKWTSDSSFQDRYSIIPLFTGSLLVSIVALIIAVPVAIAAAVYVNQIAPFKEQKLLRPTIEFISAIPSVVLGFLGIVVVGKVLQEASNRPLFSWLPGFPIESRFNMLLAGLLLAFMSVPIIFTLAEEALNKVPTDYRDGALSLGANKLQTALRIILPASLSGILAAILLGFGRVIGETMIVLLLAGNRIAIPDFSKGAGVVTEPGHTMPGVIAQGLEDAARGSIDYRALFVVGLVLFVLTLLINFAGQKIITRYQTREA